MDLFDTSKLWPLEIPDTNGLSINVIFYTKVADEYQVYSKDEKERYIRHLKDCRASKDLGATLFQGNELLVSLGEISKDASVARIAVMKASGMACRVILDRSEVHFAEETPFVEDAIYALALACYSYDFLKEKPKGKRLFIRGNSEQLQIAAAQNFARFLGDTPANLMTPSLFVEYAKHFLNGTSVDVQVQNRSQMEAAGMHLLLSVSQGSAEEPKLLHLRYSGMPDSKDISVALVGKGVTFDTGGTSIKPAAGMAAMKYDMMGAATLLAAFKVASDLKLKINVTATFPLVENMPGSKATKPGDVFKSMSGKTVEVDNTDAEGRLILADAMTFAQQDKPKYLIDAATLTGAMCVALGNVYGGFFTNDDKFSSLILEASRKTNDFVWRMPLSSYYQEALKSQVADINNMGGRDAGSAKAAEFLHHFVDENTAWAHFDIAGLMNESFIFEVYGKGATGRPVKLFVEILKSLSD